MYRNILGGVHAIMIKERLVEKAFINYVTVKTRKAFYVRTHS